MMASPDRSSSLPGPTALIELSNEVERALETRQPVVALESTIISHGLPQPENLKAAEEFESILREMGVTPATIAVLDGVPRVGLEARELRRIAIEPLGKASVRDLPVLVAMKTSAATTVAATSFLAHQAGIRVFATGGLGGVHQGASETFDESADLLVLSETPITVVSAGVKSVLDIGSTLERLETLSIPVIGYGTKMFPRFWLRESDFSLDWSVDTPDDVVRIMRARDALGLKQGIVLANPVPASQAWEPEEHDRVLAEALRRSTEAGVMGKAVTPFLLKEIVERSNGRSLEVNLDLARNNVRVAGEVAKAWVALD
jgi:pseudouridine-5'-phosphate glycosidase